MARRKGRAGDKRGRRKKREDATPAGADNRPEDGARDEPAAKTRGVGRRSGSSKRRTKAKKRKKKESAAADAGSTRADEPLDTCEPSQERASERLSTEKHPPVEEQLSAEPLRESVRVDRIEDSGGSREKPMRTLAATFSFAPQPRGLPLHDANRDAHGNRIGDSLAEPSSEEPKPEVTGLARLSADEPLPDPGAKVGPEDREEPLQRRRRRRRNHIPDTGFLLVTHDTSQPRRPLRPRGPTILALGLVALMATAVLVQGQDRLARMAREAEASTPRPTALGPARRTTASVEPRTENRELTTTEIVTDESGQVVQITGPNSLEVLRGYCTTSRWLEMFELRRWAPGFHVGVFRDLNELDSLQSIRIRKDADSGRWFAGDGQQPLASTIGREFWHLPTGEPPATDDPLTGGSQLMKRRETTP